MSRPEIRLLMVFVRVLSGFGRVLLFAFARFSASVVRALCGQANRQSKIDFGIFNLHVYTTRPGDTFLSGAFVSVLLACPSNKQFLLVLGLRV